MAVQMAIESEHVIADIVEATEFPDLSQRFRVMSVPKMVVNDSTEFVGALPEDRYLKEVMKALGNGKG
jgi:thioredoxin-related protein